MFLITCLGAGGGGASGSSMSFPVVQSRGISKYNNKNVEKRGSFGQCQKSLFFALEVYREWEGVWRCVVMRHTKEVVRVL